MRIKEYFSHARFGQQTGTTNWRGITTISSGTRIASVTAGAARSGAVINVTPMNYLAANSANIHPISVGVFCTANGFFQVVTIGSETPKLDLPVAWSIIR